MNQYKLVDLHVICEYQGVMYIKLKYVVVFVGFVLLILRKLKTFCLQGLKQVQIFFAESSRCFIVLLLEEN